MFLSSGDRDLGDAFQTHPGSQSLSRGEAKDSALLLSRDRYLLEPTEWPNGSQTSCGVWRVDSGLLSNHAGQEGPHLAMTGASHGFSQAVGPVWGFSRGTMGSSGSLSCGAREIRSPCEWRGGSHHCSRLMLGELGLKTHGRRTLEVFLGWRRESLVSLDFGRGLEGTSQGASER